VVLAPGQYEIEEASGKLSNILFGGPMATPWADPVVVHYSGGYNLPTETPLPLKHAVVLLIREERILMTQAKTAGIRVIRHKEAMVSFFDPNAILLRTLGKSPTLQRVDSILSHYIRLPC
jgi:hypothetical protein